MGSEGSIYPVEGHGFTEPESWTDEYRRILELVEASVGPRRTSEDVAPASEASGGQ